MMPIYDLKFESYDSGQFPPHLMQEPLNPLYRGSNDTITFDEPHPMHLSGLFSFMIWNVLHMISILL